MGLFSVIADEIADAASDFVDHLNGNYRRQKRISKALITASQIASQQRRVAPPPPQPAPNPTPRPVPTPQIMYHGTPELSSAYDIFYNNRWRVKTSHGNTVGVYMTPKFEEAANNYADPDGAVIMVEISPMCRLRKTTDTYHVVEIEGGTENEYYRLIGATPIAILDTTQQIIARWIP